MPNEECMLQVSKYGHLSVQSIPVSIQLRLAKYMVMLMCRMVTQGTIEERMRRLTTQGMLDAQANDVGHDFKPQEKHISTTR